MAFTSNQRAELEHQVLLTKYLVANVQIPPELLMSLSNSGAAFDRLINKPQYQSSVPGREMMVNNGASPAPQYARCLRTDGKKWQCKKPVVRGQKYCEKHMHRGRHRSLNKKGDGPSGSPSAPNRPKDTSDSRSSSPSSQDKSKASDCQQPQVRSDDGPAKRTKLEKRDSVNSQARSSSHLQDKIAARQQTRSPALAQASMSQVFAEPHSRFPDPAPHATPSTQSEFQQEMYSAGFFRQPGPHGPPPASNPSYPFSSLSRLEQDQLQDLLERGLGKPDTDHLGIPSLSSRVFANGHAAAFANTRINRDGTVAPKPSSDMVMAMLLREERAKLDREAMAAGLGYRGMPPNYMDPQDHSLRLHFEDYRSPSAVPSFAASHASPSLETYRPGAPPGQAWIQPQVSPSSPSQWQLAPSTLGRDPQGAARLARSFSGDSAQIGGQNQQGRGTPQEKSSLQRQGSERNGLQRQQSDPLGLVGNGMIHSKDSTPDGLPPHLAFLAKNNNPDHSLKPIDEERGLVRTHSLVKGGSLANRHGPPRSLLSRQPSLQSDDPDRPWLAVSMGLGDWGSNVGGPLGEALLRTASGTPIRPEDKPGEQYSKKEAPTSNFSSGSPGDRFVADPLANLSAACPSKDQSSDRGLEEGLEHFASGKLADALLRRQETEEGSLMVHRQGESNLVARAEAAEVAG